MFNRREALKRAIVAIGAVTLPVPFTSGLAIDVTLTPVRRGTLVTLDLVKGVSVMDTRLETVMLG